MGVRILESKGGEAVLYCSTVMYAFGPIFEDYEQAEAFLQWLGRDPRQLTNSRLFAAHTKFLTTKEQTDAHLR